MECIIGVYLGSKCNLNVLYRKTPLVSISTALSEDLFAPNVR